MNKKIITRFAPSPTGNLNIGGVRAGIFAYLFARHNEGEFIVRIEDTDKERSKKEYENNIFEALAWLGMDIDTTYRQSDNVGRHEELLRTLVAEDKAYVSKEEPKEGGGRSEVIRFRNPNKEVTFEDAVRGTITFDTTELKDFVIAKSFTEPVFHFAVVADDWDEGVTHVIRGEDHISNTPRQILIQEALGAERPVYAHLPLIMSSDRSKLSKRKGAKSITEYTEEGYLPEAIFNYDAFLGWHPGTDEEIFTREELIRIFDLERVQKSPAMFDETKLLWFNTQHIKKLSDVDFALRLKDFSGKEIDLRLAPLLKERVQTLQEGMDLLSEYDFLSDVSPSVELLLKGAGSDAPTVHKHLEDVFRLVDALPETFSVEDAKKSIFPFATEKGRGAVLWPLRVALSGKEKSPDPFTLIFILGKKGAGVRITNAFSLLKKYNG
ncbi:MAG TPA: glutamate--tRNA ligase [Candidatus Paceibacterota bacterium]